MSASTFNVTLKATDGISQVFSKVGHSADAASAEMVRALQAIERNTNTMAQSVQRAGTTTSQSMQQINRAGVALGAAIGTIAGTLADFSRGSEEAAQVHRQLEQAIQNTGASFETYSAAIERAGAAAVQLGYDDEAAFRAIQVLTENTGSAQVALDQLGLAEDLAAAKGMDLESAARLISRVYEGNTGILKRYGIVVTEGATATQALAQVQAQVAGQAEAHATSLARWHEELSNVADAVGGALGQFAPFVAMLPGLSVGFSTVSGVLGGLTGAMKESGAAASLLSAAMSPGGIVVAAAAATAGIYLLVDALTTDFGEATDTTSKQVQSLSDAISKLGAAGDPFSLQAQTWRDDLEGVSGVLGDLGNTLESLSGQINQKTQQIQGGMDPAFVPQVQAEIDALQKQYDTVANLTSVFGTSQQAVEAFGNAENALRLITLDTGVGTQKMRQDVTALFQAFDASPKAAADIKVLFDGLNNIAGRIPEYDAYVTAMTESARQHAEALGLQADALGDLGNAFGALKPQLDDTVAGQQLLANIQTVATQGTEGQKKVLRDLYTQYLETGNGLESLVGGAKNFADQINRDTAAVAAFNNTARSQENIMGGIIEGVNKWSAALNAANQAQQLNRQTMAQYQGMGAQADDLNKMIALNKELAQSRMEAGSQTAFAGMNIQADDLNNLIAYNAALHDNESALDRVARGSSSAAVQMRAFNDIQAGIITQEQPLTQIASEYGGQLNAIAAAQDILNQRQAEGQTLTKDQIDFLNGAADAQANLTQGQEDATIQAGMLAEKYGENIDVGTQLAAMTAQETAATNVLTDSINALILTLGGVPPDVHTDINATDNVSPVLNTILGELAAFNGTTATAVVTTLYQTIGTPPGPGANFLGLQHGGIVGAMQNGGVVRPEDIHYAANGRMGGSPTWVGEAGPEMVNLPYGSTVWPAASSKMHSRDRDDGSPHFENCSFTIVANNPRQFFDQMKSFQIGDNR